MRRQFPLLIAAVMGGFLAGSVSAAEREKEKRALRVGMFPTAIEYVDLSNIGAYQQIVFLKQVGQTLIESGPLGEVLPGLAKSWKIEQGGKLYRFELREAYFHDGTRVTSEDVAYSIKTATASKGNVASYYLSVIDPRHGIKILSPTTFEVHLTKAYSPLLSMLSSGALAITKKMSSDKQRFFLGSGPYKIVKRDGVKVRLEAFDKYAGSYPPRIKSIDVISDADLANVKRKPSADEMPDYEVLAVGPRLALYDQDRYERASTPAMVTGAIFVNSRLKKYEQRANRLALLSVFSKVLNADLFQHPGRILTDILPKGMIGYSENRPSFKALMKELGAATAPEKTTKICVNFHTMLGAESRFKDAIKKQHGLNVNFERAPFVDHMKEWQTYSCDAFFMTWQSVFLDPEASMAVFRILKPFSSPQVMSAFQNISDRATAESSEQKRSQIYAELADLVFSEAVALPVFQPDHVEFLHREFQRRDAVYRYQQMFSELTWKAAP